MKFFPTFVQISVKFEGVNTESFHYKVTKCSYTLSQWKSTIGLGKKLF